MGTEVTVKVLSFVRDGNYKSWARSMRALLISQHRLDKFLDQAPTDDSSREKDVLCKAKLQLHVSGPKAVIDRQATAQGAWGDGPRSLGCSTSRVY